MPKAIESAQIRAAVSPSGKDARVIIVEGAVYNESSSAAFLDYSAQAVLKGRDGKVLLSVPVRAEKVFPFMAAKVTGEAVVDKGTFDRIAAVFPMDDPANASKKPAEDDSAVNLSENQISLEKVTGRKVSIDKLLKEGMK
jgi:hypothetical protein